MSYSWVKVEKGVQLAAMANIALCFNVNLKATLIRRNPVNAITLGRENVLIITGWSDSVTRHVLLGLFRKRNTRNRRYLCSVGSYSIFRMNGISFRLLCSR